MVPNIAPERHIAAGCNERSAGFYPSGSVPSPSSFSVTRVGGLARTLEKMKNSGTG